MRVLHVIASFHQGGAERMILQLAADCFARGDTAAVATSGGEWSPRIADVGASEFRIVHPGRSLPTCWRASRDLAGVIVETQPDVIHSHNVSASLATRAAVEMTRFARHGRPRLVCTLHGLAPEDYKAAGRLLPASGGPIVACAPAVRRHLLEAGLADRKIITIVNGAEVTRADPGAVRLAAEMFGVEAGVVVASGRLVAQKDWPTLFEAAAMLPKLLGFQPPPILIAGTGPLRNELDNDIRSRGLDIRLIGLVDNMAAFYALGAVFVSTSRWEGLPLSLLEALSIGVPSVATDVDGISDLVPREAAILTPAGNPSATAEALAWMLSHSSAARRIGDTAREISQAWSSRAMLSSYAQLYRGLD